MPCASTVTLTPNTAILPKKGQLFEIDVDGETSAAVPSRPGVVDVARPSSSAASAPEGRTYVRRGGISPAQATIELARGRGTPRSSDPTVPSPVRSDPTLHEVLDQIERDVQLVGGVVVRGSDAQHATAVL